MKSKKLASIDIGTNTFRLLIGEVYFNRLTNSYSIREYCSQRIITRLGEGIADTGLLGEKAMERSVHALKQFSKLISDHGAVSVSTVATDALRKASNGNDFLNKVSKATGLEIRIISGEEEAAITAKGMLIDMPIPDSALLLDIGGGSTEFIFARQIGPSLIRSIDLGVVYLAGQYITDDPPDPVKIGYMEEEIKKHVSTFYLELNEHFTEHTICIGTAGTITTLSAVKQGLTEFLHDRIHNSRLDIEDVRGIYSKISAITSGERERLVPFEPARLDIIVPGTRILLTVMDVFGFQTMRVSNYGLREGILVDLYQSLEFRG